MINIPLTKILFLDIETVGISKDYFTCESEHPEIAQQYLKYFDWFQKRFPEDEVLSPRPELANFMFMRRTALVPEFAKVVCVSASFVTDKGEIKTQTFSSDDETVVLKETQKLLDRCGKLGFYLCGHNLKNFDIPMLSKRMVINGILPPSILPSYDTKPWEIKAIDTKELWQFGSYTSIGSLDLMCTSMGVPTSKDGEITGEKVHNAYWNEGKLKQIAEYCEKDVKVLIDVIKKFKELS
jgi:predicted PolB exonuclease-like 3'-5' exonuclease